MLTAVLTEAAVEGDDSEAFAADVNVSAFLVCLDFNLYLLIAEKRIKME